MPCTDQSSPSLSGVPLQRAARIQPGYSSRTRVRSNEAGTHRLLQARDLPRGAGIDWSDVVTFRPERNAELYRVSRDDILLPARGRTHRAFLVTEDLTDTLASNVFYIIRPDVTIVRPAYLAWWLNLPETQAQIDACARGTGIGYINRHALGGIFVVVPTADTQSRIESVVYLQQQRAALQERLTNKRDQLLHLACRHAVRREQE